MSKPTEERIKWEKILNRPTVIFVYEESEREMYEETKKKLRQALNIPEEFLLECNDEMLEVRVWRRKEYLSMRRNAQNVTTNTP